MPESAAPPAAPDTPALDALGEALAALLGADAVRRDPARLREYFDDYTELDGALPDLVARISDAAQVAPVLAAARAARVAVVPVLAKSNVGGLCLPARGGLVLDLMGLNRILEVNEADRYMVIEPGVTWEQVKAHLDEHHPGLRFGYALSPPDTTVLGNCLMDGLTNLSLRWGSMSDWLHALELVLPDGEIVRTGAWAFGQPPAMRSPMPGLEGLAINWHGTTGIVTKAAVAVQANPAFRARAFYFGRDIAASFRLINALARADICDDLAGLTWPLGKMLFGHPRPRWRQEGEFQIMVFVDYSAVDEELFAAKGRAIERIAAGFRAGGAEFEGPVALDDLLVLEPKFRKFADWPMRLDFLVDHEGGGLTWVGTYGPTSRWPEAVPACADLMAKRGWPPSIVTRAMKGGHFGVLRTVMTFDKRDAVEVQNVRAVNRELADLVFSYGYIPYKTPRWVVDRFRARLDPGFARTMTRIKTLLDPEGLMNPGRWLF